MDDELFKILQQITEKITTISLIQERILSRLESGDERFGMIEKMLGTQIKYCEDKGCRSPLVANIIDHLTRSSGDLETMVIEWREKKDAEKDMRKNLKKELTSKVIGIIFTICGMALSAVGAFILAKLIH